MNHSLALPVRLTIPLKRSRSLSGKTARSTNNKQQVSNGRMKSETLFWTLNSPLIAEGLPLHYTSKSIRM